MTNRLALAAAFLLASSFSLTGCIELALVKILDDDSDGDDDGFIWDDDAPSDWSGGTQVEAIGGASLAGNMGEVRNFDSEDARVRGTDYGTTASLDVTAIQPDGSAAMAILTVDGGLNHPDLRPGFHFDSRTGTDWDASTLQVGVIGCSGPDDGNWVYDAAADQVTVDVSEGSTPGGRVFDFTATFSYYSWETEREEQQTTIGSIELGATEAL